MAQIEAAASASSAKSRSATLSSELAVGRSKPSASAVICAVDREGGAGQRGGAERALVHAAPARRRTGRVAAEHLDIGHQVMAEGHRLGRLQVGEARHHGRRDAPRLGDQRALQGRAAGASSRVERVAHPQPEVERDLVVARARGVQPPGRRADQLGQPRSPRSCGCPRARARTGRSRPRSRLRPWSSPSAIARLRPRS